MDPLVRTMTGTFQQIQDFEEAASTEKVEIFTHDRKIISYVYTDKYIKQ